MTDINIGAITEALNDKSDRDLRNIDNTAGADAVIEFQVPTAENGYTWYRKYKSGWVEQGGISTNDETPTALPVTMSDTNYTCIVSALYNSSTLGSASVMVKTTTSITINRTDSATNASWQVSGMSAI